MKVIETSAEGLEAFLGKRILIMCAGYFYEGILVGVGRTEVKLKDPSIVYETGAFTAKEYVDIQKLHADEWYVRRGMIESFGASKNV